MLKDSNAETRTCTDKYCKLRFLDTLGASEVLMEDRREPEENHSNKKA